MESNGTHSCAANMVTQVKEREELQENRVCIPMDLSRQEGMSRREELNTKKRRVGICEQKASRIELSQR